MLDREGFRPNVGIILLNRKNQVFWGKRIRTHSWQFPQGGIDRGESPEQAMYRELREEVGLLPHHVRIVARTRDWLRYEVPDRFIRRESRVEFKRGVYEMALTELARFLPRNDHRNRYLRNPQGKPRAERQDDPMRAMGNLRPLQSAAMRNTLDLPPGASFDPQPPTAGDTPS